MRIAIVGSRAFSKLSLVADEIDVLKERYGSTLELVSGGALGVDKEVERVASMLRIQMIVIHADWDTHGRSAGPIRNGMIADYADRAIVFWDGRSRGTRNVIWQFLQRQRPVDVRIEYEEEPETELDFYTRLR